MKSSVLLAFALLTAFPFLSAQFTPGAIYRDYVFTTPSIDGKNTELDYKNGGRLRFLDSIDLVKAAKAEVILERAVNYEKAGLLGIRLNGNQPRRFVQQSVHHPVTSGDYGTAALQRIEVPIGELYQGRTNYFSLVSDTLQRPVELTKLVPTVILRVTYFSDKSTLAPPVIFHPSPQGIPAKSEVSIGPNSNYVSVDYALEATDTDWSGSGTIHGIHWQTLAGKASKTIGSSTNGPNFPIQWNTEWLPDQRRKMKLHCRAKDRDGLYHVATPLGYLELAPRAYGVALVAPYEVSGNWNTQLGTNTQKLEVNIEPERVVAYQLLWTSSSPCYANGLYLNGHLVWMRSGNCSDQVAENLTFADSYQLRFLKLGANVVATGKTPLVNGGKANGMEVQWPGVMMKIRY